MGIASVILGVVSMICAVAGFILSWVPFVGGVLSFGSPVLALIGMVLGGVAMSRAKEEGANSGVATAGLIVSVVAFFPALLVALTCGLCNSLCSAASLQEPRSTRQTQAPWYMDGGNASISPGITPVPPAVRNVLPTPGAPPSADPSADPSAEPSAEPSPAARAPGIPPPAFPPPPPP